LVDELRDQVIAEAASESDATELSAADIVRAYARIVAPSDKRVPRSANNEDSRFSAGVQLVVGVFMLGLVGYGFYYIFSGADSHIFTFGLLTIVVGTTGFAAAVVGWVYRARVRRQVQNERYAIQKWQQSSLAPDQEDRTVSVRKAQSAWTPLIIDSIDRVDRVTRSLYLAQWALIEDKVDRLYAERAASSERDNKLPFGVKLSELAAAGVLESDTYSKVRYLLEVRNDVVHRRDLPRSMRAILSMLDSANEDLRVLIDEGSRAG